MIEATSSFHDQSHDLWVSETILTAWEMRFKIAEFDKFIFLSTALTVLQRKWHKITDTDFAVDETLTVRELDVEKILTEIAAESSENSWSVSKSFILMKLDFLKSISSFFLLISILIDIMIEFISWLYSQ